MGGRIVRRLLRLHCRTQRLPHARRGVLHQLQTGYLSSLCCRQRVLRIESRHSTKKPAPTMLAGSRFIRYRWWGSNPRSTAFRQLTCHACPHRYSHRITQNDVSDPFQYSSDSALVLGAVAESSGYQADHGRDRRGHAASQYTASTLFTLSAGTRSPADKANLIPMVNSPRPRCGSITSWESDRSAVNAC